MASVRGLISHVLTPLNSLAPHEAAIGARSSPETRGHICRLEN